jgi:hypothetical protein
MCALIKAGRLESLAMATQIVMDHTGDTRHHFDAKTRKHLRRRRNGSSSSLATALLRPSALPPAKSPEFGRSILLQKKRCSSRGLSAADRLRRYVLVSPVPGRSALAGSSLARPV